MSWLEAYFLLIFNFLNLYLTNLHTYTSLLKINYPDNASSLYTIISTLSYLDIQQLLAINKDIYFVIYYFSMIYSMIQTLLYVLCYINLHYNHKSKPRQRFFGRWFVKLAEMFSWIFFFPFLIASLTYLLCNKDVLDSVDVKCESSANRIVSMTFSILGLIFSVINEWWLSLFF